MVISERLKMNQRFSELKKQAHDYAVDQEWYIDSFEQRFAELIVQECISIAKAGNAVAVVAVIKEQFGVK
jgi:hypothetical protein